MTDEEIRLIDHVAYLNDVGLQRVVAEFNLQLKQGVGIRWRPTKRNCGSIPGIPFSLTILCTDGCLAWFHDHKGNPFHGHIMCFSEEVEPLFSLTQFSDKPTSSEPKDLRKAPRASSHLPKKPKPKKEETKSEATKFLESLGL